MGVLRRAYDYLRGVKQRATDWWGKTTHKEELEKKAAKEFTSEKHRELRTEWDPIIFPLVQRVANLITARPPIFLDKEGNELEDLKEDWEKKLYNDLLNDVIQATRTHGYMVLEFLKDDVIEDRNWLVHDSTDIMMMVMDKLKIEKYTVLPLVEEGEKLSFTHIVTQYDLFPADVIHFYIGKWKKNRLGVATIKPIWDNAVRYSEILGAMSRYDARIGNGMMTVIVDREDYTGQVKQLKTAINNTNTKNYLVLKSSVGKNIPEIKWESATNKINWGEDLGEIMKVICGATGFNVRWFIGDPKGAQSAAIEDKIGNYQNLEAIFQEYVPFIRKLLLKQENGEALNDKVAQIQWDSGGVLDADDVEEFNKSYEDEEELEGEENSSKVQQEDKKVANGK